MLSYTDSPKSLNEIRRVLQATKFTPEFVDERIEAFVDWFIGDKLSKLTDGDYETAIATLVKEQKTADVKLSEEFDRNW